jgi:hypothetical protein
MGEGEEWYNCSTGNLGAICPSVISSATCIDAVPRRKGDFKKAKISFAIFSNLLSGRLGGGFSHLKLE